MAQVSRNQFKDIIILINDEKFFRIIHLHLIKELKQAGPGIPVQHSLVNKRLHLCGVCVETDVYSTSSCTPNVVAEHFE